MDEVEPEAKVADVSTKRRPAPPFSVILHQFRSTFDALRELVSAISPHAEDLDTKRLLPEILVGSAQISEDRRAELAAIVVRHLSSATKVPEGKGDTQFVGSSAKAEDSHREPEGSGRSLATEVLSVFGEDPVPASHWLIDVLLALSAPKRLQILYSALLPVAVGSFEVLVGSILRQHYILHPKALDPMDKEFSLADLRTFPSIADAEDAAIARRVDSLIRSGFEEWSRSFKANLKLDIATYCDDFKEVVEIFQRRHIVIHNAGRVSNQYLAVVPESSAKLGQFLEVDREYLLRAFDRLSIVGNLLATNAWIKWIPAQAEDATANLLVRSFDLLLARRWLPVEFLSRAGKGMKGTSYSCTAMQCNEWLARKRMHGIDAVRSEVGEWDTSALSLVFVLVKHTLLDELDAAFLLAAEGLKQGVITPKQLKEWPIFEELRGDNRFHELVPDLPLAGDKTPA